MKNPSDPPESSNSLRVRLIGLGERSYRKSYYPELQQRLEELERFNAFLDQSNDAIFLIKVPTGKIVDVNESSCRQLGWAREELLGASIFDLSELGLDQHARRLISGPRNGELRPELVETRLCPREGEEVPVEMTLARKVFQESGEEFVIAVARDITRRKKAEADLAERVRLAELGCEVGEVLTRGGSLEETLQRCLELLVRHTESAFGRIWLVGKEDPTVLELKASAGVERQSQDRPRRRQLGELRVGLIAQERKPYLTNAVADDSRLAGWVKEEGILAFAGYPLVVKDRLVGVVTLFSRKAMTDAVLASIGAVADVLAVGIERQRGEEALWESEMARLRLQTQLEFAAQVQSSLLPFVAPAVPNFEIAARCLPAYQVGGDFYDWQETGPHLLTLTLGDVMGKGMAAAMLMAAVRSALRSASQARSPAVALHQAELALREDLNKAESFATLFHAQLDVVSRHLVYVDCGHGFAFLLHPDGSLEELLPRGLPLGVRDGDTFQEGRLTFNRGDTLVLFSDGLVDANPGAAFDRDFLAARLNGAKNAPEMIDRLFDLVPVGGPTIDDITLLVVRCHEGR